MGTDPLTFRIRLKFTHGSCVQQVAAAMSLYTNLRHRQQTSTATHLLTRIRFTRRSPFHQLPLLIATIKLPVVHHLVQTGSIAFLHCFLQFLFLLISSGKGLTRLARARVSLARREVEFSATTIIIIRSVRKIK